MAELKVYKGAVAQSIEKKAARLVAEAVQAEIDRKAEKLAKREARLLAEEVAHARGRGRPVGTKTIKREGITYGRPRKAVSDAREKEAFRMIIADVIDAHFADISELATVVYDGADATEVASEEVVEETVMVSIEEYIIVPDDINTTTIIMTAAAEQVEEKTVVAA